MKYNNSVVQSQKVVSADFKSKQILPFAVAEHNYNYFNSSEFMEF